MICSDRVSPSRPGTMGKDSRPSPRLRSAPHRTLSESGRPAGRNRDPRTVSRSFPAPRKGTGPDTLQPPPAPEETTAGTGRHWPRRQDPPSNRFSSCPFGNGLSSILLEEGGEEVVVLLLVRKELVEEELRGLVPLLPGDQNDLLVHRDRLLLVLLVGLDHLLQRGADEDRRRLRGGDSTEVIQPLRDRFRVLHLRDGDHLEGVLHRVPLDPFPEDVLPHVLHGDLDLPGDRLVQKVEQLRGRFFAGHRSFLLCSLWKFHPVGRYSYTEGHGKSSPKGGTTA